MADSEENKEEGSIKSPFVHLHLHSMYSLLDGGNSIDKLLDRCVELGMDAVAVTDHGNMFGAAELYMKAKRKGIKPILGVEAYVAPDVDGKTSDRTRREFTGVSDGGFHLVLLAENQQGWSNLLKLCSDAYINGFYFKPRMDKGTLTQWGDGIIAINGHLGSSIAFYLRKYHESKDKKFYKLACDEAKWHAKTFGKNENGDPRFYLELQRHDTQDQDDINPYIIQMSEELGLPLVCDQDSHFLLESDWDAHDTLCCISMGKIKTDPNRLRYPKQLYVTSPQEMIARFEDVPEAVENSRKIAERCNVEIDLDANHAPVVKIAYSGKLAPGQDKLPADAEGALLAIDEFESDLPKGSTPWFTEFCAQFEVIPFDSENDEESEEELKELCDGALRMLCEAGAIWRYGTETLNEERRERLERELKILRDKLISAYFIIVWDFVNYGRKREIPIPCLARGSGVGTITGYVLGLSNACPVDYGLLFERFTDPDRTEYPDIDIDMCQDGRQDLIRFVFEKYGHVAQIITYGTLKARAAIRDVGRVHDLPLPEVNQLCELIGDGLGTTLSKALDQEPDLKELYNNDPRIREVYDTALRLEGLARHVGVHAAGVIVATQPLDNIVPLYKPPGTDQIVTQWDGPTCETVGLLKMDFLGLRTLSIIERAKLLARTGISEKTIRETLANGTSREGPAEDEEGILYDVNDDAWDPLDLERLRYTDKNVLGLFARGETKSVFQFESDGMRNTLMQMAPDRLEDLIAANALYRPGPMDLIDDYCERKKGRQAVPEVHEIVDRLTSETYGIMIYQEQVMQVVNQLGGIPLRAAYSLIKAISKKKEKVINSNRDLFIEGAADRGLNKEKSAELFDLILKFAGYGFNKSHSTGYAIVAYQTAYLKTYFPMQYMAAVLTYESVSTEKVTEYIEECKKVLKPDGRRGIEVRPPDINLSDVAFSVVFDPGEPCDSNHGHIRFGMGAIKGVGEAAIDAILKVRKEKGPFKSLVDFCERVPLDKVNKSTIEALIKCGAFDSVYGQDKRAALLEYMAIAVTCGQQAARDKASGQNSLFGGGGDAGGGVTEKAPEPPMPDVKPWSTTEKLKEEKEVLGFHLSDHPLSEFKELIKRYTNIGVGQIQDLPAESQVHLIVSLTRVRRTVTRARQEPMAMLTIEDMTGAIDAVVFPKTFALCKPLVETDNIVFLSGKVDRKRQEPNILVDDIFPLEHAISRMTRCVRIKLRDERAHKEVPLNGELNDLRTMLRRLGASAAVERQKQQSRGWSGDASGVTSMAEVEFEVKEEGRQIRMMVRGMKIAVNQDLPKQVAAVLHDTQDCCELLGPHKLAAATKAEVIASEGEKLATKSSMGIDGVCDSVDRLNN